MVRVSSGGKAYLITLDWGLTILEESTYHDRKATRKPDQEKKNVRPYLLIGLNTGMDRAFPFKGLTSGATQRWEILKGILKLVDDATEVSK